jgi:hypothetical protein
MKKDKKCIQPNSISIFSAGDKFKLQVYGEICCKDCNEIIHNHIDCPVCKEQYVGTDQYCDLSSEKVVQCESCGTEFKITSKSWYSDCEVAITKVGKNSKG